MSFLDLSEKALITLRNMAKQSTLGLLEDGFPPGVFKELFEKGLITTPYGEGKYIENVGWYLTAKGRNVLT